MRRPFVLVALWALCAGTAANAGVLPFTAELRVALPSFETVIATASGTAEVGPDGSFELPQGSFQVSATTPSGPPPGAPPQSFFVIERVWSGQSEAGSFAPGPAGFGGVMGLSGTLDVRLAIVSFPITLGTLRVPLSPIGAGGIASATAMFGHADIILAALSGGPWGTGFVGYTPPSATPFVFGSGSDARTASGAGFLSLVSPLAFRAGNSLNPLSELGLARLTFQFVPEPGGAALLLAGLALLAARRSAPRRTRGDGAVTGAP